MYFIVHQKQSEGLEECQGIKDLRSVAFTDQSGNSSSVLTQRLGQQYTQKFVEPFHKHSMSTREHVQKKKLPNFRHMSNFTDPSYLLPKYGPKKFGHFHIFRTYLPSCKIWTNNKESLSFSFHKYWL